MRRGNNASRPAGPSARLTGSAARGVKTGPKRKNTGLIAGVVFLLVALLTVVILWATGVIKIGGDSGFAGKNMEAFVAEQIPQHETAAEGRSFYIDFSDGMQWAYQNPVIRENVAGIVNKLNGTGEFYTLANLEITPLGDLSSTAIYNKIVDVNSYANDQAPLEKALDKIVDDNKPAFLLTDFEEYHDGIIQQYAYAKDAFIKWMDKGNLVVFYVMDFVENNKAKKLYFAVFDDYSYTLVNDVEKAIEGKGLEYKRFQLSNDSFPMARLYDKNTKGGNYHNSKGMDNVTRVKEDGTPDGYRVLEGFYAEYYPLAVGSWKEVVTNANEQKSAKTDKFKHLIAERYVNLTCNTGYTIRQLGMEVLDVTGEYGKLFIKGYKGSSEAKKVHDMFTLADDGMVGSDAAAYEICVELDPKFDGMFSTPEEDKSLYRIDVTVADADVRLDILPDYFAWPGNNSLLESVRNALQTCNPDHHNPFNLLPYKGTRVITFYVKVIE